MKLLFSSFVGLGLLFSGTGVTACESYRISNCSPTVIVSQPRVVGFCNTGYVSRSRYVYYPRYQSWRYSYSKAGGWFGTRYRYYHR